MSVTGSVLTSAANVRAHSSSNTSRLSLYNGDSDGEKSKSNTLDTKKMMMLPRSTSDPSILNGEDNGDRRIPDYDAPPPYAVNIQKVRSFFKFVFPFFKFDVIKMF